MSGRASREQIVAALSAEGLRFRTFTVEHAGPAAPADVSWNQHDLQHVPFVHGAFRFTTARVDGDLAVGIFLQRLFGLRLPLLVSFVDQTARTRVHQAVFGPLVLLVENSVLETATGSCERSIYSVGITARLRFVLPLAERLLRQNAARLAREDAPLRARRAELRRWGYQLAGDVGYAQSLDLSRVNVVCPPLAAAPATLDVQRPGDWCVGRADHVGLRVVRSGATVRVFPRLCLHEGAALDHSPLVDGALRCPWHGRRVAPLATLTLGSAAEQCTAHHRLSLVGESLRIEPRAAPTAADRRP